MESAINFYIEKITGFEVMTFEQRREAAKELKLDEKQHTKATLKAIFRMKPSKEAVSNYSYKNGYGQLIDCYTLSQCVPMRALSKKPRSSAQKAAASKLAEASRKGGNRNAAAVKALHAVNSGDLVCIDTETTGLNGCVIQIAVVCVKTAQVLFDSYVRTNEAISPEAFAVHGIAAADIASAPSFEQVAADIAKIIGDKKWTAFNINFDYRAMLNSAHDEDDYDSCRVLPDCYNWLEQKSFCAMYDIAAEFIGATNKYGSISLANAMAFCGVEFEGKAHSASADAVATVKVIQCIAGQAKSTVADVFDPHGARKYPYIAHVEDLLGGIGRVIYPDGDYQFGEYDKNDTLVVYSPKLPEPELEQFCKENFERYEQHYNAHQELIDNYEQAPPIGVFW